MYLLSNANAASDPGMILLVLTSKSKLATLPAYGFNASWGLDVFNESRNFSIISCMAI